MLEVIRSGAMGPHLKGLNVKLDDEEACDVLYGVMEEKACVHLDELVIRFPDTADNERERSLVVFSTPSAAR